MGKSKLTEGEVEQIREQYKSGKRPKLIAAEFHVTYHCIWLIANGWRHKGTSTHNLKET